MKKRKNFDISEYRMCLNCIHSSELQESDLVVCKKHGLKHFDDECKFFEMDLLAVRPKKLRSLTSRLSEDDFKL